MGRCPAGRLDGRANGDPGLTVRAAAGMLSVAPLGAAGAFVGV